MWVKMRWRAHVLDQSDASLPDRHAQHGGSALLPDVDIYLRAQRPGRPRLGRQPADRHDLAGAIRAPVAADDRLAVVRFADLLRRPGANRPRLRAARAGG